uniref:TF-B3 domain-containing protein n=1 Tax=Cannabis sativa TaxID=3483 RepID=A0A803P6W6_CANSA
MLTSLAREERVLGRHVFMKKFLQIHNPKRILLQDDLFDNKLKISSESMLKYGTSTIDTSNPIVLKVPSGGAWEVKLTKFDDDYHLWLGEGRFKACAKWGDGLGEHFVVPSIKTLMTIKEKEKEKDLSRNENLASQNPFFKAAFRKKDWQRFVDENHLKVGDVCIFELIDKNEMKFQVTINRANSEDNTMKFGTSSKVINGTAFEDDKLFGGEIKQSNPRFRLKLAVSGSRVQVWFRTD